MHLLALSYLLLLPREIFSRKLTKEENIMLKKECGAHELNHTQSMGFRVLSMGGEKVKPNTLPWIAALFAFNDRGMFRCSAVQISRRHILTAAHCVVDDKLDDGQQETVCKLLHLSNINPNSVPNLFFKPFKHIEVYATSNHTGPLHYEDRDRLFKMEIEGFPYVHKGYDRCTLDNDLAVIELKSDVPREVGSPICMRENEELAHKLTSVGYGFDPDHSDPKESDFHWLQKVDFHSEDIQESNTIITASHRTKSTCMGDSGGPLVQLNHENKYVLVGIVSSGTPKCNETITEEQTRESDFTNLRGHLDWICTHSGVCPIQQMGSHHDKGNFSEKHIYIEIGVIEWK
ncbi:Peptidase S1 domain-containing protein [Trichostrongylus colubriformis]|uniref:Peptidase S1 domain-containing protein n=1 Tax=Trichostrongylus colubriformis TaxID=6319 RepID=A0AAN8IX18_TRICO